MIPTNGKCLRMAKMPTNGKCLRMAKMTTIGLNALLMVWKVPTNGINAY